MNSPLHTPGLAYQLARDLGETVGPRVAGSEGDRQAVEWAMHALILRGFEPRAEPVRVRTWRRVKELAEITSPTKKAIAITALGWSAPTLPAGVEAEVVEVASLAEVQKLGPGLLAGKIVFYNIMTERTRDGYGYGRAAAVRAQGAKAAELAGAVGSIVRSVGTDTNDNTPHTGAQRADSASIPAVAVSHQGADALHALLAAGKPTRVRLQVDTEDLGETESANVVADLLGSDRQDEIVLLGAHLDAWDLGQGALDDGAGVGVVIAALDELRHERHSRTVRVVLFAAEENSLAGGRFYAETHKREIAKHVLGVEIDGGTMAAYETRLGCPRNLADQHARLLAPIMGPLGAPWDDGDGGGGADLSVLRSMGMPVLDLRQDMSTYFDIHHTSKDTVDKLDNAQLDQLVLQLSRAVEYAANTQIPFGRIVATRSR